MTHWGILPDWNSIESVRSAHLFLEGCALIFFAALVLFDVVAHILGRSKDPRERAFELLALVCFAIAVLAESAAYPYSRRNDSLSSEQDKKQREKIAALQRETQTLVNSTQQLRTDAATARSEAEGFKAKIADSDARAKHAEAQVASANAASKEAVAKSESFRLDIAKANARAAEANQKTEEEKLTRIKLEETLAPRVITITNTTNSELSVFAGTKAFIEVVPDSEARRLAGQIKLMLDNANWNVLGIGFADFRMDGVKILTKLREGERFGSPLLDAANILSFQLKDNKIATMHTILPSMSGSASIEFPAGFPEDAILIHIDFKPQAYFMGKLNEKLLDEATRKRFAEIMAELEHIQAQAIKYDAEQRLEIMKKYKHPLN